MKHTKKISIAVLAAVLCLVLCLLVGLTACGGSEEELDAPSVTLTNNELSWKAVTGADSYEVTVGNSKETVTSTSYTLGIDAAGTYAISVVAKGSGYKDSQASTEISLTVKAISSVEDFQNIANDLTAYYILTADIDFESSLQDVIGAAPLYSYEDEFGDAVFGAAINGEDVGDVDNNEGQVGIAFTGTLDGRGHTLKNYKVITADGDEIAGYWRVWGYGTGIFGWLGKTGKICNLSLSNAWVQGSKYCSFIACVNEGTIQDICIEDDCYIYSQYNLCATISAYNYGTVKNIVSYVAQYNYYEGYAPEGEDPVTDMPIACNESGETDLTGCNCYICDTTDLTSVLGGLWKYTSGKGTFLSAG